MGALFFEEYTDEWRFESEAQVIADDDIRAFVELHKFHTPTFTDMDYLQTSRDYRGRMAPGLFVLCAAEGLVLRAGLTRKRGIFLMELTPKFKVPVYAGDSIINCVRLHSKRLTSKPDRGVVVTAHEVVTDKGEVAITYHSTRMIRTRWYVETAS
ncbi:dehydratase [Caballeronia udeis]|uniref:Dehydratase n=1 Tax=Caballeronia udeis TaxID=1232866 RepID=A0A158JSE1_9BURK|nr:MaoC family dehydratase N-terminal domain-containing protein [Caballeronia udeis]SAL71727.1 dehydratase [Caballeronia udeis]